MGYNPSDMTRGKKGLMATRKAAPKPEPKKNKNQLIVWGLVLAAIIGVVILAGRPAGTASSSGGEGLVNVDSARAKELVAAGERIIDVRTPSEFEAAHMPGAENVPLDQLQAALASWDKTEPLLVYCATGARSAEAVSVLQSAGFATIHHLAAGIVSWDGDVETGQQVAQAPVDEKPTDKPVLYEFSTDW